jgi:large subunit ribosomal protein L23
MAKNIASILVTPVTTEKAYGLSRKNVYVFNVPVAANKNEIIEAVKAQYNVEINAIKTLVQSGKAVRFSRGKNRYPGTTHRSDSKKAYVTLAEGSSIAIFEQPEETKPSEEKK